MSKALLVKVAAAVATLFSRYHCQNNLEVVYDICTPVQYLQAEMFDVMLILLRHKETRPVTVSLIASFIERNYKRSQMRTDELKVAEDGFILNLLSCLLDLTNDKIPLEKVIFVLINWLSSGVWPLGLLQPGISTRVSLPECIYAIVLRTCLVLPWFW